MLHYSFKVIHFYYIHCFVHFSQLSFSLSLYPILCIFICSSLSYLSLILLCTFFSLSLIFLSYFYLPLFYILLLSLPPLSVCVYVTSLSLSHPFVLSTQRNAPISYFHSNFIFSTSFKDQVLSDNHNTCALKSLL